MGNGAIGRAVDRDSVTGEFTDACDMITMMMGDENAIELESEALQRLCNRGRFARIHHNGAIRLRAVEQPRIIILQDRNRGYFKHARMLPRACQGLKCKGFDEGEHPADGMAARLVCNTCRP